MAGLSAAISLSASAAADEPSAAARVSYADLDLSTANGAQTMLSRINSAARSVCGPEGHSPMLPRAAAQFRACVNEAVGTTVHRLDAPVVLALYARTELGLNLVSR
jgi:UrcA family protein